jgi:hypothetical protein
MVRSKISGSEVTPAVCATASPRDLCTTRQRHQVRIQNQSLLPTHFCRNEDSSPRHGEPRDVHMAEPDPRGAVHTVVVLHSEHAPTGGQDTSLPDTRRCKLINSSFQSESQPSAVPTFSGGESGLWSMLMFSAASAPPSEYARVIRESPTLNTVRWSPRISAATIVVPLNSVSIEGSAARHSCYSRSRGCAGLSFPYRGLVPARWS